VPGAADVAGWEPLPASLDTAAAGMLADCAALASEAGAGAAIAEARLDPASEIYGWVEDGELVAVYGQRKSGLSYQLLWLGVAPSRRGERYGRSALVDALRRCGRKPMTVEVDETVKGWFERVGFRTVGRKPSGDGAWRYRLGWYAPRRPDESGFGAH
jgi:ribosomal protein S18 acetylase RimI-like enzyme